LPEDKLTATGLDANFWPTPDAARDRFVLVCGLVARERVSINKAVDDFSPIEKDHLFTILEEKLDYPANLEESVRMKAVKAAISEIGTLQRWLKAHLRKKCVSEEETPFVKHAFFAATKLGHDCAGNQFSFISTIEPGDETKDRIA
jgi:hypothetical protein